MRKFFNYACGGIVLLGSVLLEALLTTNANASPMQIESVKACVIARDVNLTDAIRSHFAQCLGWEHQPHVISVCEGSYRGGSLEPLPDAEEVQIKAAEVFFSATGRSGLKGRVEIQQGERIVNAQTAYVYRDKKLNKITKIELLGEVRYFEPEHLIIARKVTLNPIDKSGKVEDALYRIDIKRREAILPAWGRARSIERFANKNYFLKQATYSNCPPQDKAWQIEADSISLDNKEGKGIAKKASLRVFNWPILYTPYLSFPTSKERKSGFLMPTIGSTSSSGFDYAQPYYWNIAPNYDATFSPHYYSLRGLMLGGQFRYLTHYSSGIFNGNFLSRDRKFNSFLLENEVTYPFLQQLSRNRWSLHALSTTQFNPNLSLGVNFQQVSDDYFLQDFQNNFAILTERQLLREASLNYLTQHWLFRGMLQSYQTLHPINQTAIENVYQRLPQLLAQGDYDHLLFNGHLSILSQFDYFQWPQEPLFKSFRVINPGIIKPEGPRYHINPVLNFTQTKPWGFFTPSLELVENYYDVTKTNYASLNDSNPLYSYGFIVGMKPESHYNLILPRYSIDTGLVLERSANFFNQNLIQTLEPRLFYLYVPYYNQTPIPVYDSGYMIFNVDQLFRKNRFSGFDRIGDANQLSYEFASRIFSEETGIEKMSFSIGQIHYFANRRVQLCQNPMGPCEDNPLTLGYISPLTEYSPLATRAVYNFNRALAITGDFVFDLYSNSTNNSYVNLHYQPEINHILNIGYSYLSNGDITQVAKSSVGIAPLNQLMFSYGWPLDEHWSTLAGYNYNLSKEYEMMSFFGIQYDSCCWAFRLIGGRSFQSLNSLAQPEYNKNIYLQILLKGLGSVGNSDPTSVIRTNLPTYLDEFHS